MLVTELLCKRLVPFQKTGPVQKTGLSPKIAVHA